MRKKTNPAGSAVFLHVGIEGKPFAGCASNNAPLDLRSRRKCREGSKVRGEGMHEGRVEAICEGASGNNER